MTVAFILTEADHAPKRLKVTAGLDISKVGAGFAITSIALDLEAHVEGLPIEQFRALTEVAKDELSSLEGALRNSHLPGRTARLTTTSNRKK
jgi:hypothetical protein